MLDPILAEYLKDESDVDNYDPNLAGWNLDNLMINRSLPITYEGIAIAAKVQDKVEAHPIYSRAIRTFTTDKRKSIDRIHRLEKIKDDAKLKQVRKWGIAAEETKLKSNWWAKKLVRLTRELDAAEASSLTLA